MNTFFTYKIWPLNIQQLYFCPDLICAPITFIFQLKFLHDSGRKIKSAKLTSKQRKFAPLNFVFGDCKNAVNLNNL